MNNLESMEHAAGMCHAIASAKGGLGSTEIEMACEALWMATVLAVVKDCGTSKTRMERVLSWAREVRKLVGSERRKLDEEWEEIYEQASDVLCMAEEELAEDRLIAEQDAEGEGQ